MNRQKKITVESNAGRILRLIVHDKPEDDSCWDFGCICSALHPIESSAVEMAIDWLTERKLIYLYEGKKYIKTTEGELFYLIIRERVELDSSGANQKFKIESLTGMTQTRSPNGFQISARSTIRNAVLPNTIKPGNNKNSDGEIYAQQHLIDAREKMQKKFGLTMEQVLEKFISGELGSCRSCGAITKFPKHKKNEKTGKQYYHNTCAFCRRRAK
jgi:hypothetical protein